MTLVELVQNNRVDTLQGWIGQQPAGQDPLGYITQPGARSYLLLKTDLVANASANLFTRLPRNTPCGQARRNPARLEHDDFAADETENRRWNTSRLPSAWRSFDDEVWCVLQGCEDLRQNRIYRKCWRSTHCVDRNTVFPAPSMRLQPQNKPPLIERLSRRMVSFANRSRSSPAPDLQLIRIERVGAAPGARSVDLEIDEQVA